MNNQTQQVTCMLSLLEGKHFNIKELTKRALFSVCLLNNQTKVTHAITARGQNADLKKRPRCATRQQLHLTVFCTADPANRH